MASQMCQNKKLKYLVFVPKFPLEIMISNFLKKSYTTRLSCAGLPAARPTSTRCMDPVSLHNKGDHCLDTNLLYWSTFILCTITCPHLFYWLILLQSEVSTFNFPQTFNLDSHMCNNYGKQKHLGRTKSPRLIRSSNHPTIASYRLRPTGSYRVTYSYRYIVLPC